MEHREPVLRKACAEGAVEVVLCVQHDLPTDEDAVRLLRWQAATLREMADSVDKCADGERPSLTVKP